MTFTVENKKYSIIKFTIIDTITLEDMSKILSILTKVFDIKKPFSFFVHVDIKTIPHASEIPTLIKYLTTWMKDSHEKIVNILQSSSIIIKSQTFTNIVSGIFKIQPTVKPNLITTDYEEGEKFVTDIMKKFLKM